MPDFDELDRLRAADPVDALSIPSATDPGPRALKERIMMSEVESAIRSRRSLFAVAAVVAALTIAGGIVLTRGGGTVAPPGDPIVPGGQALCVETYDLSKITNRETAFDGTVVSVRDDDVTFRVQEWFRGAGSPEVTLKGAQTLGGITSAGDPLPLDPGTRLLVAGDGGFAWSCGFTQPYDRAVADSWRAALS